MKRVLLLISLGAVLTCPALAQSAGSPPPSGPPPGGDGPPPITMDQMNELRAAHDAAFKADPSLETQGKAIEDSVNAYRQKVQAAMIKADPKVGPILAKLDDARSQRGGPGGGGPPPAPSGKSSGN